MLKKILLALVVALPLSAAAQKFGVVNVDEVITAMPQTAEMQKQLEESSKKYETEFLKLQEELNKLYTEFQSIQNDAATPDAIKERRMQEIQERAASVEKFRQTASQDLERQQSQLHATIQQSVNEAIAAVGKEGSYSFIFPALTFILYHGADVVDVTAEVKTKLGI